MAFDPKRHVIKVQGGREYLPVSARLVWFRSEHPDWGIVTQAVEINLEKQYAIFSCSIFNEEGRVMATATKMENVKGFGDYIEKAETGSVGRALALCGYGTQFAPELEEGPRFGAPGAPNSNRYPARNSPVQMAPARQQPPLDVPNKGMNGGARPTAPALGQIPEPVEEDEEDIEPVRPAPAPAASSPRERTPAERPPLNAPITRVKEPERDLPDPGGDDEDEEDPFGDDGSLLASPTTAPPRVRPAEASTRTTGDDGANTVGNRPESRAETREKPQNTLPRCSVEGCSNVLTAGQMSMSMQKYKKPICLVHQKDPAVVGGANGARSSGRNDLL